MNLNRELLHHLIYQHKIPKFINDDNQTKINTIRILKGGSSGLIQSILFDKSIWSIPKAKEWLTKHHFKSSVDEKEHTLRFRQRDPSILKHHGYTKFRTLHLGHGISMVISYADIKGGSLEVQTLNPMIKQSYLDTPDDSINSFVLDKELSIPEAHVYQDPITGQVVISNRGTYDASDWGNNIVYTLNSNAYKSTPRYQRAKQVQQKAIQKYGKVDTNIGHSQGAIITRGLLQDGLTNEVINVNPAYKGEMQLPHEYNIRSSGDLVSMIKAPSQALYGWLYPSTKKKNITIKSKTYNPLKEHSTDILNSLPPTQRIGR